MDKEEIKRLLGNLADDCVNLTASIVDTIVKHGLQNEQFAIDFADKINAQSIRI